ncbi:hypothetical protein [Streptomyces milbemycinicus]|uniref:Uncharacterized protein n=1 Tax=Streptomyces milbemycinicus TaxID=476552 RepID=A0ABW8LZR8_9ACTN
MKTLSLPAAAAVIAALALPLALSAASKATGTQAGAEPRPAHSLTVSSDGETRFMIDADSPEDGDTGWGRRP